MAFVCSPIGKDEGFLFLEMFHRPMKKNIVKSGLFSVSLHGIMLACCLVMPAQKLFPLFQAGNSSLTLTSLSISAPDEERSNTRKKSADRKSQLEAESDGPEMDSAAKDSPDDFPVMPKKNLPAKAAPKPQRQKIPIDADARIKGIANGLSKSAGIRPYYPLGARLRGEEGVVKVEVCVGQDGRVLDCAVAKSSGYPALDNAALSAVKQAHFVSAKSLSIEDRNRTTLTFRFDIVD